MTWVIRPATRDDLPCILAMERECFVDPWSMPMLRKEFSNKLSQFLLVESRDPLGVEPASVVGFCLYWSVVDECHLMQVAVVPAHQGQGLGRRLLESMIARAREAEAVRVFLEVRASNEAALALYQSLGFAEIGVRRGYYADPREDALVFEHQIPTGPSLRP